MIRGGAFYDQRWPCCVGFSPRAKVREAAITPAKAIAAELRTASAPDLAILVVPGCQSVSGAEVRRL